MLRLLAYLLIAVVLITVLRMVIGVVTKMAAGFFSPSKPARSSGAPAGVQTVGELKRDPVCGTYVLAENAVTRTVGGNTFYFCSEACRDKYTPA